MKNAVIIRPNDSVVTVTEMIAKGEAVDYPGCDAPVVALNDVPVYHKMAIADVEEGADVFKYGEKIGVAIITIHKGEHVHSHNLASVRA